MDSYILGREYQYRQYGPDVNVHVWAIGIAASVESNFSTKPRKSAANANVNVHAANTGREMQDLIGCKQQARIACFYNPQKIAHYIETGSVRTFTYGPDCGTYLCKERVLRWFCLDCARELGILW